MNETFEYNDPVTHKKYTLTYIEGTDKVTVSDGIISMGDTYSEDEPVRCIVDRFKSKFDRGFVI